MCELFFLLLGYKVGLYQGSVIQKQGALLTLGLVAGVMIAF